MLNKSLRKKNRLLKAAGPVYKIYYKESGLKVTYFEKSFGILNIYHQAAVLFFKLFNYNVFFKELAVI